MTTIFVAALIICCLKLGGPSSLSDIRDLYLDQSQIRAEIEQYKAIIADEQQITASYLEKEPDRQRYEMLLPAADQQPEAIGNLEKLIDSGPGRLLTMRINENSNYGGYSAQNISIKIGGLKAFPDHLISQLEHFPQLLIIEQLEWQAGEAEAGTLNLSLSLYFLN